MTTDRQIDAALAVLKARMPDVSPSREIVREMIEAAERAAWRPIEEAPKDGEDIALLDARTGTQIVAGWDASREPHDASAFGWRTLDGMSYMTRTFTHFRPLPSPPEQEQ